MTQGISAGRLAEIYPVARIAGQRITRWEERLLGWEIIDASAAAAMGQEHLGWFIGGHPLNAKVIKYLGRLDVGTDGGIWVVVSHCMTLVRELLNACARSDRQNAQLDKKRVTWQSRRTWISIPEGLTELLPAAKACRPGIAGIVILDPKCDLYRSRPGVDPFGYVHFDDVPQRVVDFRNSLALDGWLPPLILLTAAPAKSVNTRLIARTYCLDGFQFIAGSQFLCSETGIEHRDGSICTANRKQLPGEQLLRSEADRT